LTIENLEETILLSLINMELLNKLIQKQQISDEDVRLVKKSVEDTGRSEEEVLLDMGLVSKEDLEKEKQGQEEVIEEEVPHEEVSFDEVPQDALDLIHEDSAKHYKMIPVGRDGNTIKVGMVDPDDLKAREVLKFIAKQKNVSFDRVSITEDEFKEVLDQLLGDDEDQEDLKEKTDPDKLAQKQEQEQEQEQEEEQQQEEDYAEEEPEDEIENEIEDAEEVPHEEVSFDEVPQDALDLIHEDSAKHYKMIPVGRDGNTIKVGMVDPDDLKAREVLKFIAKQKNVSFDRVSITEDDFNKLSEKFFSEPEPEPEAETKEESVAPESKSFVLTTKLKDDGYINKETADSLIKEAEETKKSEEEVLIRKKIISESDLFKIKSKLLEVPLKEDVFPNKIEEYVFKKFPREVIDNYKIIPIGVEDDGKINIGAVYPEDEKVEEALKLIEQQEKIKYELFLISFSNFEKVHKVLKEIEEEFSSPFLKRLTEKGYLKKEKAKEIEKKTEKGSKTIEELILKEGLMSEEDLFEVKSDILDIPIKSDINTETIMENVLKLVPEDTANYYKMVPFGKIGDVVEVGMIAPENLRAREALRFLSRRNNFSYEIYLITLTTFKDISKQYMTFASEVGDALEDLDIEIKEDTKGEGIDMEQDIEKLAEEAPIVKIVTVLLRNAIEGRASDIHIEPTRTKLKVRFRVDGKLHASLFLPIETHLATVARIKILSGLKIDEQRLPQDGRFSAKMEGRSIDFRVSTFPTTLGEKIVIRSLDPVEGLKSMSDLGVTGKNLQILKSSIRRPTGMTLVTGPTGSGKTTTLYSALHTLNNESVNIVTLEDPVEYFIDGVSQSQVNSDIGYVFATGLRQILRQDPDIIMVGEIRDEETADLAVHASLTGHMVLSTLHTNNALGVIPRLIDMGIKPYLIPPALNTAMAQRLVRRICDKCKEPVVPTEEMRILITEELRSVSTETLKDYGVSSLSNIKLYKPKGCRYCSEEGFVGRIGVYEALRMTPDLGEIIMESPTEKELTAEAKRQRMVSLRQDGIIKAITGYTTIEEVLRVTGDGA
jgi:type IV pilus assembly protein PilB